MLSYSVIRIQGELKTKAMAKPQIVVRMPPSLMKKLNSYVEQIGTSKTDVVVSAIAQYLGSAESMPLSQRMAELERRMAALEAKEKVETN